MRDFKQRIQKFRLPLLFALVVFFVMLATIAIIAAGTIFFSRIGLLNRSEYSQMPLLLLALISVIIGTALAALISRKPLEPLREIMTAVDRVADGDYGVRVEPKGIEEFQQLGRKFNHMAEEIGSVEMLRTDFINNFSHEFKTPIVSMRGLAQLLKRDDLTAEERNQYLDLIIDESERLTTLATSVLSLSKYEQQTIVTDKKRFNVSEQIRLVIAMLDSKWSDKHIDLTFDSDEVYLNGNEEMLRQVWINLMDNAIKFSPEYGTVEVIAAEEEDSVVIDFINQGTPLSKDTVEHIFDKFYQGDTSHSAKGNGLGLPIAKKIVELHGGTIRVSSRDAYSIVFEVRLPK